MTAKERAALQRLLIIAAAWAAGETALRLIGLAGIATLAGAALGAGAYVATRDLGTPRRGGDVIYWRGRRIDPNDRLH